MRAIKESPCWTCENYNNETHQCTFGKVTIWSNGNERCTDYTFKVHDMALVADLVPSGHIIEIFIPPKKAKPHNKKRFKGRRLVGRKKFWYFKNTEKR